jgi:hypothetical protein
MRVVRILAEKYHGTAFWKKVYTVRGELVEPQHPFDKLRANEGIRV